MNIKNWFSTKTFGIVNLSAIVLGLTMLVAFKGGKADESPTICSGDGFGGDGVLDIGVLNIKPNPKENYEALKEYLQETIGKNYDCYVEVKIDGISAREKDSLLRAKQNIQNKKWDLAFTTLPMTAIAAKENNYTWVAQMWPDRSPYGRAAIIVRKDSEIESFEDIKPYHKLQLGKFLTPAFFHLPLYDLYGKTLKLNRQNLNPYEIMEKIRTGEVDLAGMPVAMIKDTDEFRIISESREIALGSVYLSPSLNETEQNTVKDMLLNAPDEVSNLAFYKKTGEEIDYTESEKIFTRAEDILGCMGGIGLQGDNLQAKPVDLFCKDPESIITEETKNFVIGKMNGYRRIGSDTFVLTLKADQKEANKREADQKIYSVEIAQSILNQHPNYESITALYEKSLKFTNVEPEKIKGSSSYKFEITRADQLEIIQ